MTFESWLRQARKNSGLTLQALADMAQLSKTQLHKYETGERRPPERAICLRLGAALGLTDPEDAWRRAKRQRLQLLDEDLYGWVLELEEQLPARSDLSQELQDLLRALRALPPLQRSKFCDLMWEFIRIGRASIVVVGLPGPDLEGKDNWDKINELGALVRELTGGLPAHKKLEYLTVIAKAHLDTRQIYLGARPQRPPDMFQRALRQRVEEQVAGVVGSLKPEVKEMSVQQRRELEDQE